MAKLSPDDLDRYVLSRTGATNEDLLVGPAYGEDAAAVAVEEGTMVVSTDPVSLAADRVGQIAPAVASNDVAASGGVPEWLTSTVLLPEGDPDRLDEITAQLAAEAERLGLTIVGGHTETVSALARPVVSLTCLGPTDRFVPTGGARPGDDVVLTKGAGIEATGVLATDFGDDLAGDVDADTLDRAAEAFGDLSVVPEAAVLAPSATAMHDPTEGGVLCGLVELAAASGVGLDVDPDAVPVRETTRRCCEAAGVDPLRVLGSGALLATVPEAETVLEELSAEGIEAARIGSVDAETDSPGVVVGDERFDDQVEDDMYDLWN